MHKLATPDWFNWFGRPLASLGLCLLLLSACGSTPKQGHPTNAEAEQLTQASPSEPTDDIDHGSARHHQTDDSLDAQSFFNLFLAEVADQRQQPWVSAQLNLQLAQQRQDPELAMLALVRAEYAGDQQTAELAAQLLLQLDGNHPEGLRLNTLYALRDGQIQQALALLDRWLALDPYPDLQSLYGSSGNLQPTQRQLLIERLTTLSNRQTPFDADRDLTLALLMTQQPDPDAEAIKQLVRQSLARSPSSTAWQLLLSLQQGSDLVDSVDDAIAAFGTDRDLHLQAVRQLYRQNYFLAGLSISEQWLLTNPHDQDFRLLAAQLSQDAGQWRQSLILLEPLLQPSASRNPAWFLKGEAHHQLGQPAQASLAWQQVLPGPWFMPAQQRLGQQTLASQGLNAAMTQLALTRHRHPEQSEELWQLQIALTTEHSDPEQTRLSFEGALRQHPEALTIRYRYGLWLWQQDQRLDALEQMEQGYQQAPASAKWQNALGYSLAELGQDLLRARTLVEDALASEPDNPAFQDSMAWVLYRLQHPTQALFWIEKTLQQLVNPETSRHHVAILMQLDRHQDARHHLNHYLELFDDRPLQQQDQSLRALGY